MRIAPTVLANRPTGVLLRSVDDEGHSHAIFINHSVSRQASTFVSRLNYSDFSFYLLPACMYNLTFSGTGDGTSSGISPREYGASMDFTVLHYRDLGSHERPREPELM